MKNLSMRDICFLALSILIVPLPGTAEIVPTYQDLQIAMDDGALLAADIYHPATHEQPWPVVLGRTPYDKTKLSSGSLMMPEEAIRSLNGDGIAVVLQDVRGRYASEGEQLAFVADGWDEEKHDGLDTVEWLLEQDWCNGKIATIGASAGGVTQILLAGCGPSGIQGQWIGLAPVSNYHSFAYMGGAYRKEMVDGWLVSAKWPLEENRDMILSNPYYNDHWRTQNLGETGRAENVEWPVVIGSAWFDLFCQGSIDLFQTIRQRGTAEARENIHLVIGPYTHTTYGQSEQGEVEFPDAPIPYGTAWPAESNWLRHWLMDEALEVTPPQVLYYVMGELPDNGAPGNEWRAADDWPPPSVERRLYLAANGELVDSSPAQAGSYEYLYNPENPVSTIGGQNFMFPLNAPAGPYDQSSLESRPDVLVFTGEELSQPMEISGRVKAIVYVSTSALDTDFTAKLTDVYPDGRSMLIIDGIRRMRMREEFTAPQDVIRSEIYPLEIDLGSTSIILNSGHKIRLAISSSNEPRFYPNPNTGNYDPRLDESVIARQNVFYGGQTSSCLILPVVEQTMTATPTATVTHTSTETGTPTPSWTATPTSTPTATGSPIFAPPARNADFNKDGFVDPEDLMMLIGNYHWEESQYDLGGSTEVNHVDLFEFSCEWNCDPVLILPYSQTNWPTIHRDSYNSDYMPRAIGDLGSATAVEEIAVVLGDNDTPTVPMAQSVFVSDENGKQILLATVGKVNLPNVYAFDLSDGSELWHSAPNSATEVEPGPDACAMTNSALVDVYGNVYVGDCQNLYCYGADEGYDAQGNRQYTWKRPMPNLRVYNATDETWDLCGTSCEGDTFAAPFVSMFFTPVTASKQYFGGVTIMGEVMLFDTLNGDLVAQAHLQSPTPGHSLPGDKPCNPYEYASDDDPMVYGFAEDATDKLTLLGVWSTGTNTDDPDKDYFMNPCQLQAYLEGNTLGGGSMVTNTPAVMEDPEDPEKAWIFVVAAQSELSKEDDINDREQDAILYRVDFDPSAEFDERLVVRNYQRDQQDRPLFAGRMPDGQNSATSPTISGYGKWIYTADKLGYMYCFTTDSGQLLWRREIGTTMGSPTADQTPGDDGHFHLYAFGNHKIYAFSIDPLTGDIVPDGQGGELMKEWKFNEYVVENCWRTDDPAYGEDYENKDGEPYTRAALGASIVSGARDKLMLVYSVGWTNPMNPTGLVLIPTHSVELVLDRSKMMMDVDMSEVVEAAYIDTYDTCEIGFKFSPGSEPMRAVISYGAQSTSMAQFAEHNDLMPEEMKSLYIKPKGGLRIVAPKTE